MSYRWSEPELEQLRQLAGDIPWPRVQHAYNTWASINGFPGRTEIALRQRCEIEGLSRVSRGEFIGTSTVRQLTGIGWPTIRRWVERGWLPITRSGRRWYIHRAALRRFAREHPEYFAGLPISDLTQLVDDERVAEELAAMPRANAPGSPKRVRCIETGVVFPSAAAAGRAFHLSRSAISLVVRGRRPAAHGHRFEAA